MRSLEVRGKGRVAYLTTVYPSVSHTFVRREILGLENLGYEVVRLAVRQAANLVDPLDLCEDRRTIHIFGGAIFARIFDGLRGVRIAGFRLLQGVWNAAMLSRASERGLLRHVAYFVQALILIGICKKSAVSHVHVHFGTNAAAVAMLAKLMSGLSYSMTVHGPDEFDAAIGLSLGKKIEHSSFTIAISDFCASQLFRWVRYELWSKIHVVRCSIESSWHNHAAPVCETSDSIVCVGRLSGQKGQLLLLDAFAKAIGEVGHARLVLVGDGEMRDEIEQRIDDLNLRSHVRVTGWADGDQVRSYLLNSRALVLASFAEGLPVVIMEAMALRRPVVATRINGIPELLVDGVSGWLVTPGNREDLAEAIVEVFRTPTERLNEMGDVAQRTVGRLHALEFEVNRLAGLLHEVLS